MYHLLSETFKLLTRTPVLAHSGHFKVFIRKMILFTGKTQRKNRS
jgi:hypothetical protein